MANFKMVSPFKAAGDQVEAIENIAKSFGEGKNKITLVGVTGSGKTFTMAEVITRVKNQRSFYRITKHSQLSSFESLKIFSQKMPLNTLFRITTITNQKLTFPHPIHSLKKICQ